MALPTRDTDVVLQARRGDRLETWVGRVESVETHTRTLYLRPWGAPGDCPPLVITLDELQRFCEVKRDDQDARARIVRRQGRGLPAESTGGDPRPIDWSPKVRRRKGSGALSAEPERTEE